MTPEDIIAAARSLVGLSGEPLASALIPTADPAIRSAIDTLSTCELAAAATIRLAFSLPDPPPFIPGGDHAARALYTLADPDSGGTPWHPAGALRVATLEEPPEVGDGIWYAGVPGHPEHVDACAVEVEPFYLTGADTSLPPPGHRVRVIAGGQPNGKGHSSAIAEVERHLDWKGGRWVCRATGRPLWCIISAAALVERYGSAEG